jgi:hypothetical protein
MNTKMRHFISEVSEHKFQRQDLEWFQVKVNLPSIHLQSIFITFLIIFQTIAAENRENISSFRLNYVRVKLHLTKQCDGHEASKPRLQTL